MTTPRLASLSRSLFGSLVCTFAALLVSVSAFAQTGNVVVSTDTTWPTGTYSVTSLTVNSGATLTIGGGSTLTSTGAVVVTANANIVLQSINNAAQVNGVWAGAGSTINAASVTVDTGSTINANSQGYLANTANTTGAGPGGGANSSTGASYGGIGSNAAASTIYGSSTAPVDLGSGGSQYSGVGGNGGGALKLQVSGALTLNGVISANGQAGTGYTASGSGGSVYVISGSLAGAGTFQALGGTNTDYAVQKNGGGGRISVSYATATGFTGFNATTAGATASATGGTVQFLDTSATNPSLNLYQNSTLPASTTTTYNNITVQNGATLTIGGGSAITSTGLIKVTGTSSILLQSSNNAAQVNGVWAGSGVTFNANSVQVDANASINADAQGYLATTGAGDGPGGGIDSNHGGSYGGLGSGQAASTLYGSDTAPVDLGSGGSQYAGAGGNGGGAIKLTATGTITLNGTISANGQAGTGDTSSGSGGSVYVIANVLTGAGTFNANGGVNTSGYSSKEGGGGRVAISYMSAGGFTGFAGTTATVTATATAGTVDFVNNAAGANNLNLFQNFTIPPSTTATYSSITVQNGATLTIGGGSNITVSGALVVTGNSAIVAQSVNNTALVNGTWQGQGVALNAATVQVDPGSTINADAQGYVASTSNGQGAGPGGGIDGNHGGSYGGAGSNELPSAVYGSTTAPTDLGSGGSQAYGVGGAGGGAIKLTVTGTLVNNGIISANAEKPTGYSSGGAGGSIYVIAQNLTGTGTFNANGGLNTDVNNKDGGGGRIAIDSVNSTGFTGFTTTTANGGVSGSVGTSAFFDTSVPAINLGIYQNFTFAPSSTITYNSVTVQNAGTLTVGGNTTVNVAAGFTVTGKSTVLMQAINNTALVNGTWQGIGVTLNAATVQVDAGSNINANGQGYIASTTNQLGAGPGGGIDGNHGGSYGGAGVNELPSAVYGSTTAPTDLGSGGSQYAGAGGNGGGAIKFVVSGTLTNNGTISADSQKPTGYSSGGSGGSIFVITRTLAGAGVFTANGGLNTDVGNKDGGGGRIAVDYLGPTAFTGFAASTVSGGVSASIGTALFDDTSVPNGNISVYQNFTLAPNSSTQFNSFNLANGATLTVGGGAQVLVSQNLHLAGTLIAQSTNTSIQGNGAIRGQGIRLFAATATIDATGSINADGQGYLPNTSNGPGDGPSPAPSGNFGASYGGAGAGQPSNSTYGSATAPVDLGSGGSQYAGNGGNGGGAVELFVSGTLTNNGSISANAGPVTGYTGGGAGGSVYVGAQTIAGTGVYSANGGTNPTFANKNGGGGRIAIDYLVNQGVVPASITVNATAGATNGTISFLQTPISAFLQPTQSVIHGTAATIQWFTDNGTGTTVTLAGPKTYTVATGSTALNTFSFDTTQVPDGAYELRLNVLDATGKTVQVITKSIVVNNSVIWYSGTLTANTHWTANNVYAIDGTLIIPAGVTLTIDRGTVVKALSGAEILVQGGTLTALGAAGNPVIFTTFDDYTVGGDTDFNQGVTVPTPGEWGGIVVGSGGTFNSNPNTILRYVQTLLAGGLTTNTTLLGTQVYEISGNLTVPSGVTLNVLPGAVVKFDPGAGIDMQPGSILLANGTLAQPIYFTSVNDTSTGGSASAASSTGMPQPGDWNSILIDGANASFSNVTMQYGGGPLIAGNQVGMLETNGAATLIIANSTIANSFTMGLQTALNGGGDTSTITDSIFYGNEDRGINAYGGSTVHVVNSTFDGNSAGIFAHGGVIDVANSSITNSVGTQFGQIEICCGGSFSAFQNNNVFTTTKGEANYTGFPDPTGTNGNISAQPVYMNGLQHDYRPTYGSPLIDAGNGTVPNYPATDAFGIPRYNAPLVTTKTGTPDTAGKYPDIGAFEFVQSAPSNLDFTVSNVNGPTSALAGTQATLTWTVTNVGAGTAYGPWHDGIYLTSGPNANPVEILAGQVLEGQGIVLGPGASYSATGTITVPGATVGDHRWEVKTNVRGEVFEGVNTANNSAISLNPVTVDLTELIPGGAAVSGSFAGTGTSAYFKVLPGSTQAVSVQASLLGGSTGSVQLFIGAGYVPSPQHFDFQQTTFDQTSATVVIPSGTTQTYYVTAYAQQLTTAAAFAIQATAVQFSLTSVSPSAIPAKFYGTSTLSFIGGGFTSGTIFNLVDSAGTVYAPTSVFVQDPDHADVTFDTSKLAAGSYAAQATQSNTITLANAVQAGGAADPTGFNGFLQTTLDVPEAFRFGFPSLVTLHYLNVSGQDIAAPLIYVNATGATLAEVVPPCSGCDPNLQAKYGTTFTAGVVAGINQQGPAGLLPAGTGGTISFMATPTSTSTASFYVANVENGNLIRQELLATDPDKCTKSPISNLCIPYAVPNQIGDYPTASAFCASLMPPGVSAQGFARACMGLLNKAGYTYTPANPGATAGYGPAGYDIYGRLYGINALVAADATQLSRAGVYEFDAQRLLGYELQSDGLSNLAIRYHQGAFGFGVSDAFDLKLSIGNGVPQVTYPDGSVRAFNTPSPTSANLYLGAVGDYGTIALQADTTYLLTETDGTQFHFLNASPGPLDYVQDRNGNRIQLAYTNGVLSTATDSAGNKLTLQFDTLGHITQITDAAGRTTAYTYDILNDAQHSTFLRTLTDATGVTSVTWNEGGKNGVGYIDDSCITTYCEPAIGVTAIAYPDNTHFYFTYDAIGRIATTSRDNGAQALTYAYPSGNVQVTDALNNSSTYTLNEQGYSSKVTDALGNVARFMFDPEGKTIGAIGPLGDSSFIGYDHAGNFASATSALGNYSNFVYLPDHGPASLTDPSGNQFTFTYDSTYGLLANSDPSGAAVKFTYDAAGRPLTRTSRRGLTTTFTYGANGLVASKTFSNGVQSIYAYDGHNNLITVTTPAGTAHYTWNAADLLTAASYPDGTSLQYTYNSGNQRVSMTDNTGFMTQYIYDSLGRLSGLADKSGTSIVKYTYDTAGQLATKTLGNGTSTTVTHDAKGHPLTVINRSATNAVLSEYDYTYDAEGRPLTQKTPTGSLTYGYDLDGQLTNVTTPAGSIQYAYDPSGNRTSVTTNGAVAAYVPNNLNQYQTANGASYFYDADGNVISGNGYTYTYNDDNKVLTMVSATDNWSFTYDGLNNRVASVHNGKTTHYLIDAASQGSLAAEFDGTGALLAHYTFGHELLSATSPTGTSSYYDFDGLGNTTQVTNAAGNVVDSYVYLPFGEQTVLAAGVANPFTFAGQAGVLDDGTGLYFMRNRWYNPSLGRFQQLDPIGFAGGENTYSYLSNSPLSGLDPNGLDPTFMDQDYATVSLSAVLTVGAQVNLHNGEGTMEIGISSSPGANIGFGRLVGNTDEDRAPATTDLLLGNGVTSSFYFGVGGGINVAPDGTVAEERGLGFGKGGVSYTYAISSIRPDIQDHMIPFLTDHSQDNILTKVPPPNAPVRIYPDTPPTLCGTCITINLHNPTKRPVEEARDPNGKITSGFGDNGYVPAGAPITYTIFFENEASATLPAQKVVVTDALSSSFDLSTVQLTSVSFNNVSVSVPPSTQTFSTQANVSTDPNPVSIKAALNPASNTITWTLQTVDPVTGGAPANPLAGFLPPNDAANSGFGSVTFTVVPRAGLANATSITNQGSITFDVNPPIVTNTVTNTIDTSAPTSAIGPLPATTTATTFPVSWSGSDPNGSGIASYNIYVSIDGGQYALFLSGTALTTANYTGAAGHSYAFVSLATNNVGVQQTAIGTPQTTAIVAALTAPTVTVTPAASAITTAQPLSVAITVASTGTPTGTVVLSSGAYTSTAVALSGGKATVLVPAGALAPGTDTLTATYTPDTASAATYSGAAGTAMVTVTAAVVTQQVTVGTTPLGASFSVDGTTYTSAQTFTWTIGATHTLATTSPQVTAGTQLTFTSWSDGGALSHTVTASTGTTTYTAAFATAYQLTTAANPAAGGTVTPATGAFYPAGTVVPLVATAAPGFVFTSWTGNVANTTSASTTVTITTAQTVTANFTATAATVTLTPTALAFTAIAGTPSAAQTVTLKNTGNGALTLTTATLTGTNAALFSQTNTCGTTVAAGATCTFTLTFSPTAPGSFTAALTLTDSAAGSPQTVALTGTATAVVPPPAPVVTLTPTTLTFSTQANTTSGAQTVTLGNTGTAALALTSVALTGTNANLFTLNNTAPSTCGTTVAAGATCTFTIAFSPTAAGSFSAALTLTDNAAASPQTVTLTGTSTAAATFTLSANPSSVALLPGATATYSITATPQGGAYTGSVTLSVTGLPPGATASFGTPTLIPGTAGAGTQLYVKTAATSGRLHPLGTPGAPLTAFAAFGTLLWISRRRRRLLQGCILALLALAAITGISGCGGSGGSNHEGTYTLTVTGTGGTGANAITQTTNVTLIIQ